MYYSTQHSSPLGEITIASDSEKLRGLWFEGQKYFHGTLPEEPVENAKLPIWDTIKTWLDDYFAGKKPSISELPLAPIGGEFRQSVWKILCDIPYGSVMTYGEIAKRIAFEKGIENMSAQAVGGAVGKNPISIIIPCHRVVGSNGSFTGYAGGIQRKIKLLTIEGVDISEYFIPKKGTAL